MLDDRQAAPPRGIRAVWTIMLLFSVILRTKALVPAGSVDGGDQADHHESRTSRFNRAHDGMYPNRRHLSGQGWFRACVRQVASASTTHSETLLCHRAARSFTPRRRGLRLRISPVLPPSASVPLLQPYYDPQASSWSSRRAAAVHHSKRMAVQSLVGAVSVYQPFEWWRVRGGYLLLSQDLWIRPGHDVLESVLRPRQRVQRTWCAESSSQSVHISSRCDGAYMYRYRPPRPELRRGRRAARRLAVIGSSPSRSSLNAGRTPRLQAQESRAGLR